MSQKRVSMKKLKDVLRLHFECQLSNRKIAKALSLSATTVGNYVAAAKRCDQSWSTMHQYKDSELVALMEPHCQQLTGKSQAKPAIDFVDIHQQLKRKGVTRELLHEEYLKNCGDAKGISYSEFCRQYRAFKKQLKPSMRQTHIAGEKIFVDYAGPTVDIYDDATGEKYAAVIFVGVLGASNYTFAQATRTRSLPDWIGSHRRMLEYFGGVSEIIVPDNEKSAVNRACRYDPDLNPNYTAFAAHYGAAVIPTRPYHPKDKAKVEVAVQIVERWILARLRHQKFFSLSSLNKAIDRLLTELNDKPFKKIPGSRRSHFEEYEKSALKPLPQHPYEFVVIKKAHVNLDYHVEVDSHYYSVPSQYIGQAVEYHLGDNHVSIFYDNERIAYHPRAFSKGGVSTVPEHMPSAHRRHQDWTPAKFAQFAKTIGPKTAEIVDQLITIKKHPEWCYRAHLGFINLHKRYGASRLEEACLYALSRQLISFTQIKSILQSQADKAPVTAVNDSASCIHNNLRGAAYYRKP